VKKIITIVAFIAIVASPAFAMYDPGPTTGSVSNQAAQALGYYMAKGGYMRPPPVHDLASLSHKSDQIQSDALQP
jgi:hypothetical protein